MDTAGPAISFVVDLETSKLELLGGERLAFVTTRETLPWPVGSDRGSERLADWTDLREGRLEQFTRTFLAPWYGDVTLIEERVSRADGPTGPKALGHWRVLYQKPTVELIRERAGALIDHAPFGAHVWQLDDLGRLILVASNPAADAILKVDHAPLIGLAIEEAFPNLIGTKIIPDYISIALGGPSKQWTAFGYHDDLVAGAYDVTAFSPGPETTIAFFADVTQTVQQRDALERSESALRSVLGSIREVVYSLDQEGRFEFVSPAAYELSGWTPEEIVGRHFAEFAHPDDLKDLTDAFLRSIEGAPQSTEARLITKDGSVKWVRCSGSLAMEGEEMVSLTGVIEDISGLREAWEALGQSEQRFRSLVQYSEDLIAVLAPDGTMLYSSDFAKRGPEAEARYLGVNVMDLLVPEDREPFRQDLERCLADPDYVSRMDVRAIDVDGSVRTFATVCQNQLDVPGIRGILVNSRDVTEQRRNAARLAEQEHRYATLYENAPDGIFILDGPVVIDANQAAHQMLGYGAGELEGVSVVDYSPSHQPDGRESDSLAMELIDAARAGRAQTFEWKHLRKDGAPVDVDVTLNALRVGGKVLTQAMLRDVTARKRQARRLDALRAIDRSISTHQLVEPTAQLVARTAVEELSVRGAIVVLASVGGSPQVVGRYGEASGLLESAQAGHPAWSNVPVETLPLQTRRGLYGSLVVHRRASGPMDGEDREFFDALAGQCAIAVDAAALIRGLQSANDELVQSYDATILGWSLALELRDHETEGHTRRVTDLAVALARRLNLPEEQVVHLRRGAMLHDIGKIGVPDSILNKPGALTAGEMEVMKQHPVLARDMLRHIAFLAPALDIPVSHHEKWDGSGYPDGLSGEAIPLAARIFALCDVFDALTSDRPYRSAWPVAAALQYVEENAGTHFDPSLVPDFLRLVDSADISLAM